MFCLTESVCFELASPLKVRATIERSDKGTFAFTTSEGIDNWMNGTDADNQSVFYTFEKCLNSLKKHEKQLLMEWELDNKTA